MSQTVQQDEMHTLRDKDVIGAKINKNAISFKNSVDLLESTKLVVHLHDLFVEGLSG